MPVRSKGRDLFIVDNSVSGWTGLRYLTEWTGIAKAFDIATGYFEIGAFIALDGKWQGLDGIRILMGAETTRRTRKALLEAVRARATERLDKSIEEDKRLNPFLRGVPAILEALRSGKIECRVYDRDKFHAKTYITHARLEVVGAQALVGSSNFTRPGLTENVELNVQIQSAREVAQLQEWFETHWEVARQVNDAVIETISRHTRPYSPFDVYAKSLQEFFRGHELTATEWDETRSRMFPKLDRYQKEAYWALMKIARRHGGAFLCDGVGLGKTFVGLMLIERLVLHEGKRVVLFAPKAAREGVWEPHLRDWLPHIGGVGGGGDFSNLAVFNHTDLGRKGDFPERFRRITELADAVIVDEAHHFRNPGRRGDPDREIQPSRYYRMFDLLEGGERPKTLFMLTATPINNRLSDFRHMAELFTRRDEKYFARTVGVNHLRAHFNRMEKALRDRVGVDGAGVAEHLDDAQDILVSDEIFRELVVQRSRAYARQSQIQEHGEAAAFPVRKDPQVASYSVRKTYGGMLDLFEKAFARKNPLFTLPMYYPLHWYRGPDTDIDPLEEGRQKQVVGLIRDLRRSGPSQGKIAPILYRPFDTRHTYYTGTSRGFLCYPRADVMGHMLEGGNVGLGTTRTVELGTGFSHIFAARALTQHHTVSLKEVNYLFPLYLHPGVGRLGELLFSPWPQGKAGRRPNLDRGFVERLEQASDLRFVPDGRGDLRATFGPEDVLAYIYSVFHSPGYRERYDAHLKLDFPRVPLPADARLFKRLVLAGHDLLPLHLLESPALDHSITDYAGPRSPKVARVGWSNGTVWLDAARTNARQRHRATKPGQYGFHGVTEDVWDFQIGGYQVCHKWLKDRKGRALSDDDIAHYQKIVVAVSETISIMAAIDGVIEHFGGWPGAFHAATESAGKPAGLAAAAESRPAYEVERPTGDSER